MRRVRRPRARQLGRVPDKVVFFGWLGRCPVLGAPRLHKVILQVHALVVPLGKGVVQRQPGAFPRLVNVEPKRFHARQVQVLGGHDGRGLRRTQHGAVGARQCPRRAPRITPAQAAARLLGVARHTGHVVEPQRGNSVYQRQVLRDCLAHDVLGEHRFHGVVNVIVEPVRQRHPVRRLRRHNETRAAGLYGNRDAIRRRNVAQHLHIRHRRHPVNHVQARGIRRKRQPDANLVINQLPRVSRALVVLGLGAIFCVQHGLLLGVWRLCIIA